MTTFKEIIKTKPVLSLYTQRDTELLALENKVDKLDGLDKENPNLRIFTRIEAESNDALMKLEKANKALIHSLLKHNPDIKSDQSYKDDQKNVRDVDFKCINAIESYIQVLNDKGITYPPESKPNSTFSDVAQVLQETTKMTNQLLTRQDENTAKLLTSQGENIEKILKTSSAGAPKPSQPFFHSKQNDTDYATFKDFLSRFEHFTKKVANGADKLEWLMSSVKGEAHNLIKNLTLDSSNYDIALNKLKAEYLNPEAVKHTLLQTILNFKCESGKIVKVKSTVNNWSNDLEELKNVHKLEVGCNLCRELLREILFYRLPADIRIGLIDECDNNYPSLEVILQKFEKVITRLQIGRDKQNSKPPSSSPSGGNPDPNGQKVETFSLNNVQQKSGKSDKKGSSKKFTNFKDRKCTFCGESHASSKCPNVKSVEERVKILQKDRKDNCNICWSKHQSSQKCPDKFCCNDSSCTDSKVIHAKLLCPKTISEIPNTVAIQCVNSVPTSSSINTAKCDQKAVALPTAVMIAHNPGALKLPIEQRNVALMLDSGGQRTLVTREAADRLGLEVVGTETACLQGYGAKHGTNGKFDVVTIKLGRVSDNNPICLDAFVVPKMNSLHMAGASKFAKKLESKGIKLADWRLTESKTDIISFDVLVGADFFYKIVSPVKPPKQIFGMWLPCTILGTHMLWGKIPGSAIDKSNCTVNYVNIQHIACENNFDSNIKDYARPCLPILDDDELVHETNAFEISRELNNFDALGYQIATREDEDKEALSSFKSNMFKDDVNNQYVVGFPWVNNIAPTQDELDSNYNMVLTRFKDTMKNLDKNNEKLQQYAETHESEVKNDFIEKMPLDQFRDKNVVKHFINHFPVWKKESATSKCRRVFDASLHKKGKACLNDKLRKGSQMTPHIMQVMMRLRLLEFLLSTDISKAFLRMVLREIDRNYTLFFARDNWMDPKSPISIWRFKSVLFGATSSPFMLNCTVADILNSNDFGQMLEVFVDNIFVNLNMAKDIIPSADNLLSIFEKASMPLHEFASNCPVANKILEERGLKTKEKMLKVLGMFWDFKNDTLYIKLPDFEIILITKRSLLSDLAKIYDILGFLGPLVILGRILVQEAWDKNLNWDTALPEDFGDRWRALVIRLKSAISVPIPRWIGFSNLDQVSIHCFSDASEKALGIVVYVVTSEGSSFFSSKPKVCPIKMAHFTVPRKELAAFALGIRHLIFVINAIGKYCKVTSHHIWSDSTLTLTWCSSRKSHKDMFIRYRVSDVQAKLDKHNIKMHYILNKNNPADLLTKDSEKSVDDPLWKCGPDILRHPERWHIFKPTKANIDAIPIFCGHTFLKDRPTFLPEPSDFQSLKELLLATVQIIPNLKELSQDKALHFAELQWVKWVQDSYYADACDFLIKLKGNNVRSLEGKKIIRVEKLTVPTDCLNLHLFLDTDEVIRVYTSLANCPNLTYDEKFPILLPNKDKFTILVIVHNHVLSGHLGLHHTRSQLRHRFWIPKDTNAINSVVNKCTSCNTQRGQRYHVPDSPPLPEFRFDVQRPWNVTCLDMTGHFYFKDKYGNAEKVYFIVFVCSSTGSGHIEMSMDASSESFANSFDRFTSRRGVPSMVISDHGSNFQGYQKELPSLNNKVVQNFLEAKGISWRNTPMGDPHFNGYCERHLGILKSIMKKAIKNRLLTLDQLHTVACYAEGLFNERPLSVLDANDPNFVPITPNTLVYGRSLRHFDHSREDNDAKDPEFSLNTKSCEVMQKKLRSTLASVRKTWISEYLNFLARRDEARQKRSPSTKSIISPKVNDWVLIKDESKDFRIGRIVHIIHSDDGEIRSVKLKTGSHEGIYPVTNLRYLEFHKPDDIEQDISNETVNSVNPVNSDNVGGKRPSRLAAIKAKNALSMINE